MRIHRVHTPQPLDPGTEFRVIGDRAHYLSRVLRVSVGQAIVLFNGDSHDYASTVLEAGKKELVLSIDSRLPGLAESPLRVTVVQALSRGERMDQTLQKCTELGAYAFQPLISARVELKLKGDRLERRLAHWQGVVISACEQSGRSVVPAVFNPMNLDEWLAAGGHGPRMVLAPEVEAPLQVAGDVSKIELVVGPEGGFSQSELEKMTRTGVVAARLGSRILRTETAGPAALAVLQAQRGDFRSISQ